MKKFLIILLVSVNLIFTVSNYAGALSTEYVVDQLLRSTQNTANCTELCPQPEDIGERAVGRIKYDTQSDKFSCECRTATILRQGGPQHGHGGVTAG